MAFEFSKTNLPKQLFINNEFVSSKNSKKLTLYNPKDGSLIADDVDLADEHDVDAAVKAAEKALPAWKKLTNIARRDILLKFASLIEEHGKSLAELTRITLGAPYGSFGAFETGMAAEAFKYNAGWIDKFAGESFPQEDGFLKIVRNEPLGVTAGIVPWNGPLGTVGLKAAPALATGNCFILKPSEKTPFASLALGPLIKEAGFPPGVFQVLSGDGSTGALIASHMRIRKVSFTGSIPTGKRIQEAAARSNLKRVTLELGGKSPAVVFDDANLENAVSWLANAITANTGQVCFAATRVYVQEGIYDKFVQGYKDALLAKGKTIGDPDKEGTVMGPLIDKAQFDRVSGFISRGKEQNQGTLLTGGSRVGDSGFFIEPTVFENVGADSELLTQEIFGPVAVLNSFKTEDEIIERSNATNFGLMAGVFTQDVNRALRVASAFDSGMVGVNCVSLMMLGTPFGGSKESGIGRECGRDALLAYTERKTVMVNMNY
ncbi:ALDH-like protein [Glarea lozoyensis ATCC 20868]|uniref:aldehyde dehydrogenase (NAD(+)) n=1 Tax=Glarea lozoyensis (strain ATCC 20868 / MF5171) TaxID=1116229 RepID=S3DC75_GLAL2|nr:ALDH-like protein [Glarea lozoyensis ATCC 20868]EPE24263.1 ALDH-like protein [Glarea lozoyensis ATCC 20868]